ncbi:heterokaryon incompatibility protein-domain-containing protein [Xylaria sp. FL0064]|nr:heterokaryon incompatibility protein-domain-containing protein [Xylaria sp. FL0064]
MRLINTSSLKLEEFLGEPTDPQFPRYAILSHTWGAGEVTFQDMQEPEVAKKKAGYDKIAKCCETALNEAWAGQINSMFKWYEHSTICYAYLSDVGIPESDSQAPPVHSDWRIPRWFTRGWTLQELVAPFEIIIYDREWNQLGTKRRVTGELSKKTLIPEKAMQRQTTRIEDRAYPLLDLFDINMPLLYGEGKKALSRLQTEILNTIDDDTVFLGGLAPREEDLWLAAYARSTENDFLVSPGNVFDDIMATLQPTRGTGELITAQAFPSMNVPVEGDVLSMSMRIIQVTLPNRPPPRAYFTLNKQFLDDMDPANQRILQDHVFDRLRSDGRYPCLGMPRCGKDDQFVARYFMCKLVEQEIFAYPMPIYRFVPPKVVYHWPEMQCNIQLNRGAWEPSHFMKPLRHPASWVLLESPVWSNVTLDNGWAFALDLTDMDAFPTVYRLFFEQRDEVWKIILNRKGAFGVEIALQCSTNPEFEAQTVNVEHHEHEGPVVELWRRMPVLGGSAELVVSVYCEVDSRLHFYSPMIRFRAFEPSDNEQTGTEPKAI